MKKNGKEPTLDRDTAVAELEKWFDAKKLDPDQRENINEITERDENRETLIRGFMYGTLVLDPQTFIIEQKLKFPLEKESGEVICDSLKYKHRLNQREVQSKSIGLKAKDIEGKISAYIAALTKEERNIINLLDTSDRKIADAIVTYFL